MNPRLRSSSLLFALVALFVLSSCAQGDKEVGDEAVNQAVVSEVLLAKADQAVVADPTLDARPIYAGGPTVAQYRRFLDTNVRAWLGVAARNGAPVETRPSRPR